jgi:hypothetical protein
LGYAYSKKKGYFMSQSSNYEINKRAIAEKKAGGCERCGFQAEDPCQLELDHMDPATKHVTKTGRRPSPGSMVNYNPEFFALEISKCRVLCSNCHRLHTKYQSMSRKIPPRGPNRVTKMSDPYARVFV